MHSQEPNQPYIHHKQHPAQDARPGENKMYDEDRREEEARLPCVESVYTHNCQPAISNLPLFSFSMPLRKKPPQRTAHNHSSSPPAAKKPPQQAATPNKPNKPPNPISTANSSRINPAFPSQDRPLLLFLRQLHRRQSLDRR